MVDGLKLYDEHISKSEVSELVSLVDDMRAAGKRGQIQGKLCLPFSSVYVLRWLTCFIVGLDYFIEVKVL